MDNQESTNAQIQQDVGAEKMKSLHLEENLSKLGWALFFIWVGLAFLGDFGAGSTLLGIGLITLLMQIVRRMYSLNFEGFWVVIGILFALGGLWELSETDLPLLPILLIIAGVLMIISMAVRKKPTKS